MKSAAHDVLRTYLAEDVENPPVIARAMHILEHAAQCDECGRLLAEKPRHAVALLEATHRDEPLDPLIEKVVEQKQLEVWIMGRAVLVRLTPSVRTALTADLPPDRRNELWTLEGRSIPELRAALAVSETSLGIQSVLAGNWDGDSTARFVDGDLVVDGNRTIPRAYFIKRIAEYAVVDVRVAQEMWDTIVDVVRAGVVGLPDLAVQTGGSGPVLSLLDEAQPEMPDAAVMEAVPSEVESGLVAALWGVRRRDEGSSG